MCSLTNITSRLAAQAGLEGAERQAEARKKLQQRQAQLTAKTSRSETQFFPPDFARHYQVGGVFPAYSCAVYSRIVSVCSDSLN